MSAPGSLFSHFVLFFRICSLAFSALVTRDLAMSAKSTRNEMVRFFTFSPTTCLLEQSVREYSESTPIVRGTSGALMPARTW